MSTQIKMLTVLAVVIASLSLCLAAPEQVHLAWNGRYDQMRVTWVTFEDVENSVVRYGLQSTIYTASASATDHTMWLPIWKGRVHDATMTDLIPGKRYFYQVGDGVNWSNEFSFTAKEVRYPIRFAVYGDFGDVNSQSLDMLKQEVADDSIDMILHVGDIAYDLHDKGGEVGDNFMRHIEPVAAAVPYMVCPGNHESAWFFSHYKTRFSGILGDSMMGNSGNNLWYSFDYGNMHIVSISTEHSLIPLTEQHRWLEADLIKANQNRSERPWLIIYGHRPHYCSNRKQIDAEWDCLVEGKWIRQWMEPLFLKYKVDLYLCGHMHSYERLWPIIQDKPVQHDYINPKAPAIVISGSAGCREWLNDNFKPQDWSAFHSSAYGYGHLTVHNNTHLHWEQISVNTSSVIDEFWMTKE